MNLEQIIPVKEAEEYMIRMAEKKQEDSDTQEELKSRHKLRQEYWKQLLEKVDQSETKLYQNISPSKEYWLTSSIGVAGVGFNFVIAKNFVRTELMLARSVTEENKYIFDQLYSKKNQIEEDFGGELTWERLDGKKSCRIKFEVDGVSYYEKQDWSKMNEILIDGMIRMEKALKNPVRQINQKMKKQ